MASPVIVLNTVRHLRPAQIYHRLYRPKPRVHAISAPQLRTAIGKWIPSISKPSPRTGENLFCFLNQERQIASWNDPQVPKLWLYNLHYFDSPESDLIDLWVLQNPIGSGNGWEPYPTSLRIINWIKWALDGGELSGAAQASLQTQAHYLLQSIEHHLGANHVLANAVALTMAGLFFDEVETNRCLAVGIRLLQRELEEQILSDGGHYERSPMYHSIVLEQMLDLVNASRVFTGVLNKDCQLWIDKAQVMLGWLKNLVHRDEEIAFFNDATFGIAPGFNKLTKYAERLSLVPANSDLGESGYIRLEHQETVLLFDAGPIGPDYQPGHAHADTLSFELSHRGKRLLVNSGISTYEKGHDRQWQRGTAAHNTIRIDDLDQSEVWSAFRVGRRARPLDVRTDGKTFVEAAHDGYKRLRNSIIHRRRIEIETNRLVILDSLEGSGHHRAEIFFHFHPEAKPNIQFDFKLGSELRNSSWYSGFNTSIQNRTAIGTWTGKCPVQFKTVLSLSK